MTEFPHQDDPNQRLVQPEQLPEAEAQPAPPVEVVEPEAPREPAAEVVEPNPEPAEPDAEPTHIADIDHDEAKGDKLWDKQKAETIATTLIDDPNFNKAADHYKENAEAIQAMANVEKEHNDRFRGKSPDSDKYYDELEAEQNQKSARQTEAYKEHLDDKVNKMLSPFEELYDHNPAVFAEMPTKDFMAAALELVKINGMRDDYEEGLEWDREIIDEIDDSIRQRKAFHRDYLVGAEAGLAVGMDAASGDAMKDEFRAVRADTFDKSPHQIMQEYRALIERHRGLLAAEKEKADQQRQAFLDKYKPETPPTPDAGAEEQPAA